MLIHYVIEENIVIKYNPTGYYGEIIYPNNKNLEKGMV